MSDDRSNSGNIDRAPVSLEQGYEVRDQAKRFGVSQDALRKTVARVGPREDDVQRELGGRR